MPPHAATLRPGRFQMHPCGQVLGRVDRFSAVWTGAESFCHEKCMIHVKGTDGKLRRPKVHRARAPAHAVPRDLHGGMLPAALHAPVKTACQKLFSVTSSVFLRFAGPAGAGRRRRRAEQDQWRHVV